MLYREVVADDTRRLGPEPLEGEAKSRRGRRTQGEGGREYCSRTSQKDGRNDGSYRGVSTRGVYYPSHWLGTSLASQRGPPWTPLARMIMQSSTYLLFQQIQLCPDLLARLAPQPFLLHIRPDDASDILWVSCPRAGEGVVDLIVAVDWRYAVSLRVSQSRVLAGHACDEGSASPAPPESPHFGCPLSTA